MRVGVLHRASDELELRALEIAAANRQRLAEAGAGACSLGQLPLEPWCCIHSSMSESLSAWSPSLGDVIQTTLQVICMQLPVATKQGLPLSILNPASCPAATCYNTLQWPGYGTRIGKLLGVRGVTIEDVCKLATQPMFQSGRERGTGL